MRQTSEGLEFFSSQPADSSWDILERYFRFDNDDTKTLYEELSNNDPMMGQLIQKYYGTRILRQEPWECLVAYICSANNKISQISRIVEKLSDWFGETINIDGETRYAFPTPERVLDAGLPRIRALNLGLKRAESISRAARKICNGSLDLNKLIGVPYPEASTTTTAFLGTAIVEAKLYLTKPSAAPLTAGASPAHSKGQLPLSVTRRCSTRQLFMECPGIGEKIADCVCLFSLDKLEAFPIDRHIGEPW